MLKPINKDSIILPSITTTNIIIDKINEIIKEINYLKEGKM